MASSQAAGPLVLWAASQLSYCEIERKVEPLKQEVEKLESDVTREEAEGLITFVQTVSTSFRGYSSESLEEAIKGSERRARSTFLEAPSRRMQMVFGVQGAKHDGVVSLEAHKRGTKIWFDMLSLDVRGSKQHMFLKGDKDRPLFPEIAEVLGGLRK